MAAFTTKDRVREYLGTTAATGKWTDPSVDAAIVAASGYLQTKTGRQFELQAAALKEFTTHGAASLVIPDLQSVVTVKHEESVLIERESYWLLPDKRTPGIFTGIQLRHYGSDTSRRGDAWDRNMDPAGLGQARNIGSVPLDLQVDGKWGYGDPEVPDPAPLYPDEVLFATTVLSAFYVLRPDSVLGNISVTPDGAIRSYADLPIEVRTFIEEWRLGEQAALV